MNDYHEVVDKSLAGQFHQVLQPLCLPRTEALLPNLSPGRSGSVLKVLFGLKPVLTPVAGNDLQARRKIPSFFPFR